MDHAVQSSALHVAKWILIQNAQVTWFFSFSESLPLSFSSCPLQCCYQCRGSQLRQAEPSAVNGVAGPGLLWKGFASFSISFIRLQNQCSLLKSTSFKIYSLNFILSENALDLPVNVAKFYSHIQVFSIKNVRT